MGLIARHAEAAGIATLCMSSAFDITKAVNSPRAVFLDYPLGHTAGPPDLPEIQREILKETLRAFDRISAPGTIETLPFLWPEDPKWKTTFSMSKDERLERVETPQYQTREDRLKAECE